MAKASVRIRGEVHELWVTPDKWSVHREAILAYADGAEIEFSSDAPNGNPEWTTAGTPSWRLNRNYRIKKPLPNPGEVWDLNGAPYLFTNKGWIKVEVQNWNPFRCSIHKKADTLEEYINGNGNS